MRRHLTPILMLMTFVVLGAPPRAQAQTAYTLSGRAYDGKSKAGIPNLVVKLIPPSASLVPIRITTTDAQGSYKFAEVTPGRYLLQAHSGTNLLYREAIDFPKEGMQKDIRLQK
jgi:SdrD B-like domain